MLDNATFRLNQRLRVADVSKELLRLEIGDAAKARNQVQSRGCDPKKREISKSCKDFRGGMSSQIASLGLRGGFSREPLGGPRQHDPGTFQRGFAGIRQKKRDTRIGL